MENETKCACEASVVGLYSCAGASNTGQMANKVAVELTKQGKGNMMCTAGIGGNVPGIMKSTEGTDVIITIDGCPLTCAKKSLENAGFIVNKSIVVTEMGMKKNKDFDLQDAEINEIMTKVEEIL